MIIGVVLRQYVYDNGYSDRAFFEVVGIKGPGLARAQGVSVQYISYGFIAYDRSLSVLWTFLVGVKLD